MANNSKTKNNSKKNENIKEEVTITSKKVEKCEKGNCSCNRKKLIIGLISLVVIAVIVVILVICLGGKKSNEKELEANMEKLGGQFYEKFYYPRQETAQKDVKAFMKDREKTGIIVDLENIAKVSNIDKTLVESMVNNITKEECDKVQTKARIIPRSPYGLNDYDVEVTLSCGFEAKTEEAGKKETSKKEVTKKETKTNTKEETKKETKTEAKKDTKTETKKTTAKKNK